MSLSNEELVKDEYIAIVSAIIENRCSTVYTMMLFY